MSTAMQELLSILDLEELEHNLYRGRSPRTSWQRVFGGQTIAQALVAAQRTVGADRHAHSLHGYFMLPGDTTVPIVYEVDRIRDGGSFATRRVVAIQHGAAIFSLEASFQKDEQGLEHQFSMPRDVPPPSTLKTQRELLDSAERVPENIRKFWARERPFEIKPVSLQLAKDQRLSLNPAQISGCCGRLMCCLTYEHQSYVEARKRFPREGRSIRTARGEEKVIAVDIWRERVQLKDDEGSRRTVDLAELREEVARAGGSLRGSRRDTAGRGTAETLE